MTTIELIAEILKYVVPAVLVLLAVKFVNDSNSEKEKLIQDRILRNEILKQNLPLKITAYERAVLYLERISPENILPRLNGGGKTVQQFHSDLLFEIRSEFEHNLAQQIYINNTAWLGLVRAKEEILNIINASAKEVNGEEDGIVLARKILEKCTTLKEMPSQKAIFLLKSDIQKIFSV